MYDKVLTAPAASVTGGTLALTGPGNLFWMALAGFALIAAGSALMRIAPRLRRQRAS
jgi:hypothetical protein